MMMTIIAMNEKLMMVTVVISTCRLPEKFGVSVIFLVAPFARPENHQDHHQIQDHNYDDHLQIQDHNYDHHNQIHDHNYDDHLQDNGNYDDHQRLMTTMIIIRIMIGQ